MAILILFAFIAGFITILSPCILPILPIVLSGSLSGGKKRPFGIVAGFIGSFTFFTLSLATLISYTGISPDILRIVAIVVIGFFGFSLVIPQTQLFLEKLFSKLSVFTPRVSQDAGFFGGLLIGVSLGLVWAPCVGPILASVITLAITSSVTLSAVFITLAYSLGTAIPMFAITMGGRQLLQRVPWLLSHTATIQKVFGILMILTAFAIWFNVDRKFQSYILETFPQYGTGLTKIEDNQKVQTELEKLSGRGLLEQKRIGTLSSFGKAPDFTSFTEWVNTEPLLLSDQLKGKVVLVDFWTYTCINCIRTFPYLTTWYEKYKDQGFVIVGVHSPEFQFEKKKENVVMAMKDFGITYPVVQDNDFAIWQSYRNQYWPAHYLIDKDGTIRYQHFGEGKYDETENAIRTLLELDPMETQKEGLRLAFPGTQITHETYLGYERATAYTSTLQGIREDTASVYDFNDPLLQNEVGLRGTWTIEGERITSGSDTSTLSLRFTAGKVFLVLGGINKDNIPVIVKLDGKDVTSDVVTKDYNLSGGISVHQDRKYDILDLKGDMTPHTVELTIPSGISAYAFTFGES